VEADTKILKELGDLSCHNRHSSTPPQHWNEKLLSSLFSRQLRRIQGRQTVMEGITSLGCIIVRLKLERARAREEHPSTNGSTKLSKNTKVSVVKLDGSRDKYGSMRDARTSDPNVEFTANKMMIGVESSRCSSLVSCKRTLSSRGVSTI